MRAWPPTKAGRRAAIRPACGGGAGMRQLKAAPFGRRITRRPQTPCAGHPSGRAADYDCRLLYRRIVNGTMPNHGISSKNSRSSSETVFASVLAPQ